MSNITWPEQHYMTLPHNLQILILYLGDLPHHIAIFSRGLNIILDFSLSPTFTPIQRFVKSTFDILNSVFSFSAIPALC